MTARTVRDQYGEPVTLSDVGPMDPAREHNPATCEFCAVGDCWAARIPGGPSCVNGCAAGSVEAGLCVVCREKQDRANEWVA